MAARKQGRIRVGVGGWTFEPWRETFYPKGLPHKRELEYASRQLTSIEINGTYYGSQKPESFARWHNETPEDFVFSLKAPRFATNRKVLAQGAESIDRFFASGVLLLKDKLGPINWQFMDTKKFEPDDFAKFLSLLPRALEGRTLRHVVELRHASFATQELVTMAREAGIAIVVAGDSHHPQIADATASFAYLRIMGTTARPKQGYTKAALDLWASRAKALAAGGPAKGLEQVEENASSGEARDVFLYVIGGCKERNPAAARALIERVAPARKKAQP